MGMPVAIEVLDDIEPSALTEAFARLRRVDATFSTYCHDSQISQLDRGTLEPDAAHADVREVLACCEAHRVATGGFFDIRATGRLDPSGFVKGWAVERAAAILGGAGARRLCINAGGDVLVRQALGEAAHSGVHFGLRGRSAQESLVVPRIRFPWLSRLVAKAGKEMAGKGENGGKW